jgi:hypothetical protein
MVYQDVIDWLKDKNFGSRENAELYIKNHQQGIIYSQQMDALDYYFKEEKEEPFKYEATFKQPLSPLRQLQEQQLKRDNVPIAKVENIPAPVQETQIQESRIRRLVRRLFGR